jgi:hypothetical protein
MPLTITDRIPRAPTSIQTGGSTEDRDRRLFYAELADFWDGLQWDTKRKSNTETRLVLNYARSLIRKSISYTLGEPAQHTVVPSETMSKSSAEDYEKLLKSTIESASADETDTLMLTDASIYGEGVTKITWDVDRRCPVMAAIHPNQVNLWVNLARPDEVVKAEHGYYLAGFQAAQHFRQLPESVDEGATATEGYPVVETWTADRWQVTINNHLMIDQPNPYGLVPYVPLINEPRTGRQWGQSDLWDLMDVCQELNQRMSTLAGILKMSGSPIAVLEGIDGAEGIKSEPGAKWELPEGAKAYLLDLLGGNGVSLHIDTIEQLRTSMHDLAEIPRSAFGDSGRTLSGAALEVELQPAVHKARRKRKALSRFYRRRNQILFELLRRFAGEEIPDDITTAVIFPNILPTDRAQDAVTAAQLVASGIRSRRAAAADLGEPDPQQQLTDWLEESRMIAAQSQATTQPAEEQTRNGSKASVRSGADPGASDPS